MKYYARSKCRFDVDKYLQEPANEEECLTEEETIITTLCFENGFTMDIKCNGVHYTPGYNNAAWTEAVLFDETSREVVCSEVCEEYFGEWILEFEGDEYHGFVDRKDDSHVYSH